MRGLPALNGMLITDAGVACAFKAAAATVLAATPCRNCLRELFELDIKPPAKLRSS
jgi:hypothetical protein